MELEKFDEHNDELSLRVDSAMSIIQTSDAQIRALVKPRKPLPLVNHMVLWNIKSKNAETYFVGILAGSSVIPLSVGFGMTLLGNFGVGIPLMVLSVSAFTFGLLSAIRLDSNRKSLGHSAQKLWQKMGLPARKLQALETERATKLAQYKQGIAAYEATANRLQENVKPALEIVNQQSTKYRYSFDSWGLEGTSIVEEPTTWVEQLAKDLESVDSISKNLSI